jgi:hypothetical protein
MAFSEGKRSRPQLCIAFTAHADIFAVNMVSGRVRGPYRVEPVKTGLHGDGL